MRTLSKKQYKQVLKELLSNSFQINMKVWIDFENDRLYTMPKDRVYYLTGQLNKVFKEDWEELPICELKQANKVILADNHFVEITEYASFTENPEEETKKEAVCALIPLHGKYLTVSRKTDSKDIGMPGGKVELGETLEQAVIREVLEETGYLLDPHSLRHVYTADCTGYLTYTFVANIQTDVPRNVVLETGVVSLSTPSELVSNSSFKVYNKALFDHLKIPI